MNGGSHWFDSWFGQVIQIALVKNNGVKQAVVFKRDEVALCSTYWNIIAPRFTWIKKFWAIKPPSSVQKNSYVTGWKETVKILFST